MGIEYREATSNEMRKNVRTVKRMTNGMCFDENMNKVHWKLIRIISSIGYRFMPKEKDVKFYKIKTKNSKILVAEPMKVESSNIVLYIHGGGFVSGSVTSSKGYSSMLAKYSGCRVFLTDYALAPENKFPCGFNDCYKAFCEISELYPNSKIILVGESAGANLCIALALKVKTTGRIQGVIVHSPIIDMTEKLDRNQHPIDDFTVKQGFLRPLKEMYIGIGDAHNPHISPIYGEFDGFPPIYITCDYNETLYADSKALYDKCESVGVKVQMVIMKNTFHAFATIGTGTPETLEILKESVSFMSCST